MKAYLYASPKGAQGRVLSQCVSDFAELFRHGILTDSSTVWVNAESTDTGFWALTDRSQYIYLLRTNVPGYARVTKGRIRWARSYGDTASSPLLDLDANALTKNPDSALTLIVKHRDVNSRVSVINDKLMEPSSHGVYTLRNLTVLDLGQYRRPDVPPPPPSEFEQNSARYQGANHLLHGLDADNAELVRRHLEVFALDIPAEQLQSVNDHLDVVDQYAAGYLGPLYERLASLYPPQSSPGLTSVANESASASLRAATT